MVQIRLDRIEASGQPPDRTFTVYVTRLDTNRGLRFGYHQSQFMGLNRQQIRTLILGDIKTNLDPQQPDTSQTAGFTSGEVVDLGT